MNGLASGLGTGIRRTVSGNLAVSSTASQMQLRASGFVPPHRTQLHPRFSTLGGASALQASSRWRRRMGMLTGLLVVLLSLLAFLTYQFSRRPLQGSPVSHGILIDAGSSGTRLHVFQYSAGWPIPVVAPNSVSLKIRPGLSSFANSPLMAGGSLEELVQFAKQHVPPAAWSRTPVYLMATAGLRLLEEDISAQIIESCRGVLRSSGFRFKPQWASVISGTMEGVYAWVAANYAQGRLGSPPEETMGVIELGGASAQVTFVPEQPPPAEFRSDVSLGGQTYIVYTHSFLNYGQEAAQEALHKLMFTNPGRFPRDPCLPTGSEAEVAERARLQPEGNFSSCRLAAQQLLQNGQDKCMYTKCAISSAFIPELRGKFFATENFYYTAEFLGLPSTATLGSVKAAGEQFCATAWESIREEHKDRSAADLLKYCFSTSYMVAFLHDSLGIAMEDDDRVMFTNRVGGVALDWALGALVLELGGLSTSPSFPSLPWDWLGEEFLAWLLLGGAILLCALATITYARSRKPVMTTIYDLEKGRYFITAGGRSYR